MPKKKKKKESWKEKRRRAALKRERALEAERIRREREPKKRRKGWPRGKVFGVLFLISLCLISYGVWQYTQPPTQSSSPPPNENKAPSFTLTDIDGATFSLADFKGKVVVLNFFDTYCTYCIPEISELAKVYVHYSSNDVVILSIDVDPYHDTVPILQQFREAHNISWAIAQDTAGVSDDYTIIGTPTTVIIDQEGFISPHGPFIGLASFSTLSREIDSLLSS